MCPAAEWIDVADFDARDPHLVIGIDRGGGGEIGGNRPSAEELLRTTTATPATISPTRTTAATAASLLRGIIAILRPCRPTYSQGTSE